MRRAYLLDNLLLQVERGPDDRDRVALQISSMRGLDGVHSDQFFKLCLPVYDSVMWP